MIKVSLDEMMKHVDNQYRLLRVAAKRCKQLSKGAKPRVDDIEGLKHTTVALREIAAGQVPFSIGTPPSEDDATDATE